MKTLVCILLIIPALAAFGQKEVRTWYDQQKNHVQEKYFVSPENDEIIVGEYNRYYENGNTMVNGTFDNGVKNGLFTEYHENGKVARKINYVNGLRHGKVEVFND